MISVTIDKPIIQKHEEVWNNCLNLIKENVPGMTFNTWFLPIKALELNENSLKVQLPSQFFWEWIDEHYNSLITKTIKSVIGENANLTYVIVEEQESHEIISPVKPELKIVETTEQKVEDIFESNLNSKYRFENFIKGEGNQLARAAAGAISENPGGTSFNPLFIYGGVGLGKTHLTQAIGNKILENFPDKKIRYKSADNFTVEFVDAIQRNKANEFSALYKGIDVLIIDDIQFLVGKEKTQDLFFHIFNALHQSGKQIILSSDKPPKDLQGLDERLISRFQWGLTADIKPPDFETRIAILTRKANDIGIFLDSSILEYIAANITSNIRELEGCLIKLLALTTLDSKSINMDLAKKVVRDISTNRKITISIDFINKIVCEHFNIDENKIRDKSRKKEFVNARQIAMYLSKEMTNSSLKTIGLHYGGRDHTTVIHSCNSISEMIDKDVYLKETIDNIKNKIEISSS